MKLVKNYICSNRFRVALCRGIGVALPNRLHYHLQSAATAWSSGDKLLAKKLTSGGRDKTHMGRTTNALIVKTKATACETMEGPL